MKPVAIPPHLADKSPEQLASMMPPIYLKFASLVANGKNTAEAYRTVRPNVKTAFSNRLGYRLAHRPIVRTYVDKLKARANGSSQMALDERRELLTRVARGDEVVDKVVRRIADDGSVDVTEHTMSRAAAIKMDAELSGDLSPNAVDVTFNLGNLLAKLGDSSPFVDIQDVTPTQPALPQPESN